MKKIFIAFAAGCFPALVFTNLVIAQTSINPEILEPQKNVAVIQNAAKEANGSMDDVANINASALNSFAKKYKNVTGESWEKLDDGFAVRFTSNDVRNIIYYHKNGKWAGSLKGYEESKMPADIRRLIKPTYFDYSITYVQEVETPESNGVPTYIIHLQDKDSIKMLRVYDGAIELWKDFPRAN